MNVSGGGHMTGSDTQTSAARRERRHKVARRLYEALVDQDPDRVITLFDGRGKVMARHDLRAEQDDPQIPSGLVT
jgi:hypothetical protein